MKRNGISYYFAERKKIKARDELKRVGDGRNFARASGVASDLGKGGKKKEKGWWPEEEQHA